MKRTVAVLMQLLVLTAILNVGWTVPLKFLRQNRNVPLEETDEFSILLQTSSPKVTAAPKFTRVDTNKDGYISFKEFQNVMSTHEPWLVQEMFGLFDTNDDQKLTEQEYDRFYQDANSYLSQTTDENFERFEAIDTNEDQNIDQNEFRTWTAQNGGQIDLFEKLFKLSDKNNDGLISFSEFVAEL